MYSHSASSRTHGVTVRVRAPGLGYAEATQVVLDKDPHLASLQFAALVTKYFKSYQLDPDGKTWDRLDPNDAGRDYRNIIGIPGGVKGPLYKVLVSLNVHNMTILEGYGGQVKDGQDEGFVYVCVGHACCGPLWFLDPSLGTESMLLFLFW